MIPRYYAAFVYIVGRIDWAFTEYVLRTDIDYAQRNDIEEDGDTTRIIHVSGKLYSFLDLKTGSVRIASVKSDPVENEQDWNELPGLTLSKEQWNVLAVNAATLKDNVPELKTEMWCALDESHQNQDGYIKCPRCNPWKKTFD